MSTTNILRNKAAEGGESNTNQDFSSIRAVQIDCVLRTVAESIEKLKISLMLPHLFQNFENVCQILKGTEFEDAIPLLQDFRRRREGLVRTKVVPLLDHKLVRMIDYFQEHFKILKLFPDWKQYIQRDELKLIAAFELLYNIASQHLHKSAKLELSKERKLHQMYNDNEVIKKNIIDLKKKLRTEKLSLRWRMLSKEVYLQKFEDELMLKKRQNNIRIQNEIAKCTRELRNNQKITLDKQKELEEELEKTKAEYERSVKSNLQQEKEARAEKNKYLIQLQGLLKKYDQNIGEKMRENIALHEEYDEVQKKMDEFMVIYNREEAIYTEIVLKREEEERLQQQRRVLLFMMNRAARIIQRYWRAWRKWQRKKAKKLGGGKKGKKK